MKRGILSRTMTSALHNSPGRILAAGAAFLGLSATAFATNPFITDQFTADPTARVFEGKVYVYPSHDIPEPAGYSGRPNWFVMEDYHVFSSENLTDWTDHGVILTRGDVPWADQTKYAMWAPDCVFKDGKYYFYFPAMARADLDGGGMRIGVAVSDTPYGPFKPEPMPIEGVRGIDPGIFIDVDGSAYMSWSAKDALVIAKLKPNMREIEGEPIPIDNLPKNGLQEGPLQFARDGVYYLTYPHKADKIERLEYATSSSPLGPFTWRGVMLDESPSGCWTVHQSVVEFRGQWYLFYHDRDLSPAFDKHRSIRADKLFFEADGSIRKVMPTLRGVGVVDARSDIQIDRYSARSSDAIAVSFLDESNPHAGWKTTFNGADAWVRFDAVDFGRGGRQPVQVRARSAKGGVLDIRLDAVDGPLLGRVTVAPGGEWSLAKSRVRKVPAGVHDLIVILAGSAPIEVDWVTVR